MPAATLCPLGGLEALESSSTLLGTVGAANAASGAIVAFAKVSTRSDQAPSAVRELTDTVCSIRERILIRPEGRDGSIRA